MESRPTSADRLPTVATGLREGGSGGPSGLDRKRLISSLATIATAGAPTDQIEQAACDVLRRGIDAKFTVIAEMRADRGVHVVRAAGPVAVGPAGELIAQVATEAARTSLATVGDHLAAAVPDSSRHGCVLVARVQSGHTLSELELAFVEEVVLLLAITRALRRQRELEERLTRSQRLESVGKLAGGIAHDFNNLLAVILNYATFVSEALDDSQEEIRTDMREITQAAERAAELTRRLLLFARGERYSTGSCAPSEVVGDLAKTLQTTVGQGLSIDFDLAHYDCEVAVSADELEQAAIALVVNAHDAMPRGGRLVIRDELTESALQLRFTDAGTGMTPEVLESALDPFFTTKAPGEGSGLGLSTVHGVVERAGGKVLIESEPGTGTTVTLVLPRLADAESLTQTRVSTPSASALSHTVLVVDDQAPLREVVRRILESAGYRVLEADSVTSAQNVLKASGADIDLLLTDVLMPGGNGVDLASHVADAYSGQLPVVFMSGFSDGALAGSGASGAVRIIRKPFTRERLLDELGVALGRSGGPAQ